MIIPAVRPDARHEDHECIAWNDIEALPLYAASLLALVVLAWGLAEAGGALMATTGKAAALIGCLGLRFAWLGMDDMPAG